tara:strand:- start:1774 stop:2859 length:1086 start_codon:yes stop_codon:yes gene_type:complete
MPKYPKHLFWLDSLRFLAALIVVISHTRNAVFVEYGLLPDTEKSPLVAIGYALTRISNEAVIMFFVLSGFLVGGRATSKIFSGEFDASNYAIDRISRIMVPLVPALAFTVFVVMFNNEPLNFTELVGNLFSLQGIFVESFGGNEPLWSLSYEVWFYILVFALGLAVNKRRVTFLSLCLLVLIFIIFCFLLPSYLFCWLIGAIVYFMPPAKHLKSTLLTSMGLIGFGVIAIQLGSGSRSLSDAAFLALIPNVEISRIILSMGMALFVRQVILLEPKAFLVKKFDVACTNMAKASYTLYLTHFPLIHLFSELGLRQSENIDATSISIFIAVLAACVAFSGVFYFLFERHTLLVRNYLKRSFQN